MEVAGTDDIHIFQYNSTYVMVLLPCLHLDSSLSIARLGEPEGLLSG